MRMTERLLGLKKWTIANLCAGREMKAPGEKIDIADIRYREPACFLGWAPMRMDKSGNLTEIPESTVPGIIIMPNQAYAKYMEEKRFDRYNNINRAKQMGQHLAITFLFSVYEPGIRLPGFAGSAGEMGQGIDPSLILEATEEGLLTLMGWMDDCVTKLLGAKEIPNTDLFLDDEKVTYSLYTDQQYITDRRPLYYGFINVDFGCYAEEAYNEEIEKLL